ncbi:MAG: ABC transporter permease [Clostridia bacterium]|nr:ABC transporter permease [Clostridia bacterium]
MKTALKKTDLLVLALPVSLLAIWYLIAETGKVPSYLLPSPKELVQVLMDFAWGGTRLTPYSGTLVEHTVASIMRVLVGFSLAAVLGLVFGLLTGRISVMRRLLDPTIHLVRAVPGIGWLPLAMVWFGVGEKTTVFLIALAAFFPVYINAAHGFANVPLHLIRAGQMLGADKHTLFTSVILPAAFPSIIVGLRLGLGVSWGYLVLGELTGVAKGLGAVMMDSRLLGQTEMIPIAMISIGLLGKLTDMLLIKICNRVYPGNVGKVAG